MRALLSKLLELDGQALDEFFAALRRHDGVVSGSSLLCAIVGDSWEPQDCNILLPGTLENFYAFVATLRKMFQVCAQCGGNLFAAQGTLMYTCLTIRRSTWNLTLLLAPEPAAQRVLETSEFDFLKNTFDGVSLAVHDMQSVRTRTSAAHFAEREYGSWRKLYEARGFRVLC